MTSSPTSSLWVLAFKILNLELAYWGCHQVMPEFGLLIQFRMSQNPMKEIKHKSRIQYIALAVVPRLSQVWLFLTRWTSAHQASLSFTISCNLPKLMSLGSVIPSNHLIPYCLLSSCLQSFSASGSFPMSSLFASGGQSIGASTSASVFLIISRVDFL